MGSFRDQVGEGCLCLIVLGQNPYSDLFKLPSSLSGDTEAGRPLWEKQGAQWLALGLVATFRSSRPVHGRLTAN